MVKFVQPGNSIDYIPSVDTPAGTVVVRYDLVGVTKLDIKAGALGSLAVAGVFDFPIDDGVPPIDAGNKVYWNDGIDRATLDIDDVYLGKAVKGTVVGEIDTVAVRLSQ